MRPLKLRYSAKARAQLSLIHSYIAEHNPRAATAVVERIRAAAELLQEFPRLGRDGREPGTREWVVRGLPYIVVYELDVSGPDELMVLAVFHGARDR
jgi:plasmid stabilization system protein ParE